MDLFTVTLLNKVCFHNTPSEFPNTPRCVVVTHLFTVLYHSSRKHTIVCKETHKVFKADRLQMIVVAKKYLCVATVHQ